MCKEYLEVAKVQKRCREYLECRGLRSTVPRSSRGVWSTQEQLKCVKYLGVAKVSGVPERSRGTRGS